MAQPGTDAELRPLLFSIAYRARRHLEARKPRFEADRRRQRELAERFLAVDLPAAQCGTSQAHRRS